MYNYRRDLEKKLESFKFANDWSDFISMLGSLEKTIKKMPPIVDLNELPVNLLQKRLNQCLNPVLPAGVHNKVIRVYSIILQKLKAGEDFCEEITESDSSDFDEFLKDLGVKNEEVVKRFEDFIINKSNDDPDEFVKDLGVENGKIVERFEDFSINELNNQGILLKIFTKFLNTENETFFDYLKRKWHKDSRMGKKITNTWREKHFELDCFGNNNFLKTENVDESRNSKDNTSEITKKFEHLTMGRMKSEELAGCKTAESHSSMGVYYEDVDFDQEIELYKNSEEFNENSSRLSSMGLTKNSESAILDQNGQHYSINVDKIHLKTKNSQYLHKIVSDNSLDSELIESLDEAIQSECSNDLTIQNIKNINKESEYTLKMNFISDENSFNDTNFKKNEKIYDNRNNNAYILFNSKKHGKVVDSKNRKNTTFSSFNKNSNVKKDNSNGCCGSNCVSCTKNLKCISNSLKTYPMFSDGENTRKEDLSQILEGSKNNENTDFFIDESLRHGKYMNYELKNLNKNILRDHTIGLERKFREYLELKYAKRGEKHRKNDQILFQRLLLGIFTFFRESKVQSKDNILKFISFDLLGLRTVNFDIYARNILLGLLGGLQEDEEIAKRTNEIINSLYEKCKEKKVFWAHFFDVILSESKQRLGAIIFITKNIDKLTIFINERKAIMEFFGYKKQTICTKKCLDTFYDCLSGFICKKPCYISNQDSKRFNQTTRNLILCKYSEIKSKNIIFTWYNRTVFFFLPEKIILQAFLESLDDKDPLVVRNILEVINKWFPIHDFDFWNRIILSHKLFSVLTQRNLSYNKRINIYIKNHLRSSQNSSTSTGSQDHCTENFLNYFVISYILILDLDIENALNEIPTLLDFNGVRKFSLKFLIQNVLSHENCFRKLKKGFLSSEKTLFVKENNETQKSKRHSVISTKNVKNTIDKMSIFQDSHFLDQKLENQSLLTEKNIVCKDSSMQKSSSENKCDENCTVSTGNKSETTEEKKDIHKILFNIEKSKSPPKKHQEEISKNKKDDFNTTKQLFDCEKRIFQTVDHINPLLDDYFEFLEKSKHITDYFDLENTINTLKGVFSIQDHIITFFKLILVIAEDEFVCNYLVSKLLLKTMYLIYSLRKDQNISECIKYFNILIGNIEMDLVWTLIFTTFSAKLQKLIDFKDDHKKQNAIKCYSSFSKANNKTSHRSNLTRISIVENFHKNFVEQKSFEAKARISEFDPESESNINLQRDVKAFRRFSEDQNFHKKFDQAEKFKFGDFSKNISYVTKKDKKTTRHYQKSQINKEYSTEIPNSVYKYPKIFSRAVSVDNSIEKHSRIFSRSVSNNKSQRDSKIPSRAFSVDNSKEKHLRIFSRSVSNNKFQKYCIYSEKINKQEFKNPYLDEEKVISRTNMQSVENCGKNKCSTYEKDVIIAKNENPFICPSSLNHNQFLNNVEFLENDIHVFLDVLVYFLINTEICNDDSSSFHIQNFILLFFKAQNHIHVEIFTSVLLFLSEKIDHVIKTGQNVYEVSDLVNYYKDPNQPQMKYIYDGFCSVFTTNLLHFLSERKNVQYSLKIVSTLIKQKHQVVYDIETLKKLLYFVNLEMILNLVRINSLDVNFSNPEYGGFSKNSKDYQFDSKISIGKSPSDNECVSSVISHAKQSNNLSVDSTFLNKEIFETGKGLEPTEINNSSKYNGFIENTSDICSDLCESVISLSKRGTKEKIIDQDFETLLWCKNLDEEIKNGTVHEKENIGCKNIIYYGLASLHFRHCFNDTLVENLFTFLSLFRSSKVIFHAQKNSVWLFLFLLDNSKYEYLYSFNKILNRQFEIYSLQLISKNPSGISDKHKKNMLSNHSHSQKKMQKYLQENSHAVPMNFQETLKHKNTSQRAYNDGTGVCFKNRENVTDFSRERLRHIKEEKMQCFDNIKNSMPTKEANQKDNSSIEQLNVECLNSKPHCYYSKNSGLDKISFADGKLFHSPECELKECISRKSMESVDSVKKNKNDLFEVFLDDVFRKTEPTSMLRINEDRFVSILEFILYCVNEKNDFLFFNLITIINHKIFYEQKSYFTQSHIYRENFVRFLQSLRKFNKIFEFLMKCLNKKDIRKNRDKLYLSFETITSLLKYSTFFRYHLFKKNDENPRKFLTGFLRKEVGDISPIEVISAQNSSWDDSIFENMDEPESKNNGCNALNTFIPNQNSPNAVQYEVLSDKDIVHSDLISNSIDNQNDRSSKIIDFTRKNKQISTKKSIYCCEFLKNYNSRSDSDDLKTSSLSDNFYPEKKYDYNKNNGKFAMAENLEFAESEKLDAKTTNQNFIHLKPDRFYDLPPICENCISEQKNYDHKINKDKRNYLDMKDLNDYLQNSNEYRQNSNGYFQNSNEYQQNRNNSTDSLVIEKDLSFHEDVLSTTKESRKKTSEFSNKMKNYLSKNRKSHESSQSLHNNSKEQCISTQGFSSNEQKSKGMNDKYLDGNNDFKYSENHSDNNVLATDGYFIEDPENNSFVEFLADNLKACSHNGEILYAILLNVFALSDMVEINTAILDIYDLLYIKNIISNKNIDIFTFDPLIIGLFKLNSSELFLKMVSTFKLLTNTKTEYLEMFIHQIDVDFHCNFLDVVFSIKANENRLKIVNYIVEKAVHFECLELILLYYLENQKSYTDFEISSIISKISQKMMSESEKYAKITGIIKSYKDSGCDLHKDLNYVINRNIQNKPEYKNYMDPSLGNIYESFHPKIQIKSEKLREEGNTEKYKMKNSKIPTQNTIKTINPHSELLIGDNSQEFYSKILLDPLNIQGIVFQSRLDSLEVLSSLQHTKHSKNEHISSFGPFLKNLKIHSNFKYPDTKRGLSDNLVIYNNINTNKNLFKDTNKRLYSDINKNLFDDTNKRLYSDTIESINVKNNYIHPSNNHNDRTNQENFQIHNLDLRKILCLLSSRGILFQQNIDSLIQTFKQVNENKNFLNEIYTSFLDKSSDFSSDFSIIYETISNNGHRTSERISNYLKNDAFFIQNHRKNDNLIGCRNLSPPDYKNQDSFFVEEKKKFKSDNLNSYDSLLNIDTFEISGNIELRLIYTFFDIFSKNVLISNTISQILLDHYPELFLNILYEQKSINIFLQTSSIKIPVYKNILEKLPYDKILCLQDLEVKFTIHENITAFREIEKHFQTVFNVKPRNVQIEKFLWALKFMYRIRNALIENQNFVNNLIKISEQIVSILLKSIKLDKKSLNIYFSLLDEKRKKSILNIISEDIPFRNYICVLPQFIYFGFESLEKTFKSNWLSEKKITASSERSVAFSYQKFTTKKDKGNTGCNFLREYALFSNLSMKSVENNLSDAFDNYKQDSSKNVKFDIHSCLDLTTYIQKGFFVSIEEIFPFFSNKNHLETKQNNMYTQNITDKLSPAECKCAFFFNSHIRTDKSGNLKILQNKNIIKPKYALISQINVDIDIMALEELSILQKTANFDETECIFNNFTKSFFDKTEAYDIVSLFFAYNIMEIFFILKNYKLSELRKKYISFLFLFLKTKKTNLNSYYLHLLNSIIRIPEYNVSLTREVYEFLLTPQFFDDNLLNLRLKYEIIKNSVSKDTQILNIIFERLESSIFTSKEVEMSQKAATLKRISFIILCGEKNFFKDYIQQITKIISTNILSTHITTKKEIYSLLKVCFLKYSSKILFPLFPIVYFEINNFFEQNKNSNAKPLGYEFLQEIISLIFGSIHDSKEFMVELKWAFCKPVTNYTTKESVLLLNLAKHINRKLKYFLNNKLSLGILQNKSLKTDFPFQYQCFYNRDDSFLLENSLSKDSPIPFLYHQDFHNTPSVRNNGPPPTLYRENIAYCSLNCIIKNLSSTRQPISKIYSQTVSSYTKRNSNSTKIYIIKSLITKNLHVEFLSMNYSNVILHDYSLIRNMYHQFTPLDRFNKSTERISNTHGKSSSDYFIYVLSTFNRLFLSNQETIQEDLDFSNKKMLDTYFMSIDLIKEDDRLKLLFTLMSIFKKNSNS